MLEIFRRAYSAQRLDVTSEINWLLMFFIFHVKYIELQIFVPSLSNTRSMQNTRGNMIDKTIRFQFIRVKLGTTHLCNNIFLVVRIREAVE